MALRQILFDTETTGFDPYKGDRIVEIGAIEVVDYLFTGREFHYFINPQRDIPAESTKIHGITNEMVKDAPVWASIMDEFLGFVEGSVLVAHNAEFDRNFINHHLEAEGRSPIEDQRFMDSLAIAKKKYPGQLNSLDALCRRFNIDLEARKDRHGALLDSLLLADVWLELHGGRQISLFDQENSQQQSRSIKTQSVQTKTIDKSLFQQRHFTVSAEEQQIHQDFLKKHIPNHLWKDSKKR